MIHWSRCLDDQCLNWPQWSNLPQLCVQQASKKSCQLEVWGCEKERKQLGFQRCNHIWFRKKIDKPRQFFLLSDIWEDQGFILFTVPNLSYLPKRKPWKYTTKYTFCAFLAGKFNVLFGELVVGWVKDPFSWPFSALN